MTMASALWICLAALGLTRASAQLVVCPKTVAAGQAYGCFVSAQGANPAPSSILLVDPLIPDIPIAEALPDPQNPSRYLLVLPPNVRPGNYVLQGAGDAAATIRGNVHVGNQTALVVVETDKALYSQRQNVTVRVLGLGLVDFQPIAFEPLDISVTGPHGVKIFQLNGSTDAFGVAKFEFPITNIDARNGVYNLSANFYGEGRNTSGRGFASFSVEEYIPPKFLVNFTLDSSYVTTTDSGSNLLLVQPPLNPFQTVTGKVFSEYPFGENVIGEVLVTVWAPTSTLVVNGLNNYYDGELGLMSFPRFQPGVPVIQPNPDEIYRSVAFVSGLQMTGSGYGTSFQVKIPNQVLIPGQNLIVQASVRTNTTLERENATMALPVLYDGAELQVHLQTWDNQQIFKPGLPTTVQVILQKPDGRSVTAADLSATRLFLVVTQSNVNPPAPPVQKIPFSADASGYASVQAPTTMEDPSCCNPLGSRTTYQEYLRTCACCANSYNIYVEALYPGTTSNIRLAAIQNGRNNLCLNRAYSPTGHYLKIQSLQYDNFDNIEDNFRVVTLLSDLPAERFASVEYMVLQAGKIVSSGLAVPSTPLDMGALLYHGMTINIALPVLIPGEMLLVVSALDTEGGPPMAASARFSRPFQVPYNLTGSFNQLQAAPGDSVSLRLGMISGSSNSNPPPGLSSLPTSAQAYLTSIDRSQDGLGARFSITMASILGELRRIAGNEPNPIVSVAPWTLCGKDNMMVASLLPANVSDLEVGPKAPSSDIGQPYGVQVYACPRPIPAVCPALTPPVVTQLPKPPGLLAKVPITKSRAQSWLKNAEQPLVGAPPQAMMILNAPAVPTERNQPPQGVTNFALEAFAICSAGVMSADSGPNSFQVIKPFVLTARLPESVVRFEDFDVVFAVFTFGQGSQVMAQVTYVLPDGVQLHQPADPSAQGISTSKSSLSVNVQDNSVGNATIHVLAAKVGNFTISVTISASGMTDTIQIPLRVRAEGIPMRVSRSFFADLSTAPQATTTLQLPTIVGAVSDTLQISVAASGDLLGPAIIGLENLVSVPFYGCGEQNLVSLAPSVYVGAYLDARGKLSAPLRDRIVRNIITALEREMAFRRSDGSFSAFGAKDTIGSTWLTAFVVQVLSQVQASKLVGVSTDVIASAVTYLMQQQNSDGSFKSTGNVIRREMMGYLAAAVGQPYSMSAGPPAAFTAFVTIALAKAKRALYFNLIGLDVAIQKATQYLLRVNKDGMPIYDRLLRAYALVSVGAMTSGDASDEALQISNKSVAGSATDMRWWQARYDIVPDANGDPALATPRAINIETTAYGVLLLVQAGTLVEAAQGVRWLVDKQNAQGGFMSTQDTVVALAALAAYDAAVNTAFTSTSMSVEVTNGATFDQTLQVDDNTLGSANALIVPPESQALTLKANGNGQAAVVVSMQYSASGPRSLPCYDLTVDWLGVDNYAPVVVVRTCVASRQDCPFPNVGGMTMLSVGLFTGYSVVLESMTNLTKNKPNVKKWALRDAIVDLYIEELTTSGPTCVDFNVTKDFKVNNLQAAVNEVYNYYAPDAKTQMLQPFIVSPYAGTALLLGRLSVDGAASLSLTLVLASVLLSVVLP